MGPAFGKLFLRSYWFAIPASMGRLARSAARDKPPHETNEPILSFVASFALFQTLVRPQMGENIAAARGCGNFGLNHAPVAPRDGWVRSEWAVVACGRRRGGGCDFAQVVETTPEFISLIAPMSLSPQHASAA